MKSSFLKWRTRMGCAMCLACLGGAVNATPSLSFQLSNVTPNVGDRLIVDILAGNIADLYSFNLDIGFDPGTLALLTAGVLANIPVRRHARRAAWNMNDRLNSEVGE